MSFRYVQQPGSKKCIRRSLFQSIGRENGVHYDNPQALVKTGKKTY